MEYEFGFFNKIIQLVFSSESFLHNTMKSLHDFGAKGMSIWILYD
jgi:hypothetical protein